LGGAVLHAAHRVPGKLRGAVIGAGGGAFRLLVHAFGLLAGLLGGFVDRLAALLECLETGIRHKSLRRTSFGEETRLLRKSCMAPLRPSGSQGCASIPPQSV